MEWTLQEYVKDGFVKDSMAVQMLHGPGERWLHRGVIPQPGHRLYMQLNYELRDEPVPACEKEEGSDGDHADLYRGWARMTGRVSEVLPRAPIGVYVTLPGDEPTHTDTELAALREQLPKLGPSFVSACTCGVVHTRELQLGVEGAVHGDRVRGVIELSCDDAGRLEPQLAGAWAIELIYDDTKECSWCLCSFARADEDGERFLRRHSSSPMPRQSKTSSRAGG